MFEYNDKKLITMSTIVNVTACILAALFFIGGIALCALISGWFIFVSIFGVALCWIMWVMARLYLSFLCDVKLIRNKLYGVDNDGLDIFISSADKFEKTEEGYYDKSEHLKQLKMLLDAGVLTQEEYDKKKEEVINSNK